MPNKRDLMLMRGRSVIAETPQFTFTPIRDTTGRVHGIEFDWSSKSRGSDPLGLVGAYVDLSGRNTESLIGELDFNGITAEEARAEVERILDSMRNGTLGKRDIRDVLAGRGDPAGAGWIVPIMMFTAWAQTPQGAKTIDAAGKVAVAVVAFAAAIAANVISDYITDLRHESEQQKNPKDPKLRPAPDGTDGGKPTAQQLRRISIRLKDFVPPYVDDILGKDKGKVTPKKPIDRHFDPAINWGENDPDLKKYNINSRIVKNDGFTDPVRE